MNTRLFAYISIFLFSAAVLVLHIYTPILADDYCYAAASQSFSDAVNNAFNMYWTWTGRSLAHLLTFSFLLFDKIVFNLVATIALFALILLLIGFADPRFSRRDLVCIAILCLWLGLPAFAEAILWIGGAGNYLFTTLFTLAFMVPYVRLLTGDRANLPNTRLVAAWWALFGVAAGWTNENTAPAMLIGVAALTILAYRQRKTFPLWAATGMIGTLIGIVFMLVAPGNKVRLHSGAASLEDFLARSMLEQAWEFFHLIHKHAIFSMWPIWVVLIIAGTVLYMRRRRGWNPDIPERRQLWIAAIFFACYGMAVCAMVMSPYVEKRALTGPAIFLTVTTLLLWGVAVKSDTRLSRWATVTMPILVVAHMAGILHQYHQSWQVTQEQRRRLAECAATNASVCSLPNYQGKFTRYFILPDFASVSEDPYVWGNRCRARHAGVLLVRAE